MQIKTPKPIFLRFPGVLWHFALCCFLGKALVASPICQQEEAQNKKKDMVMNRQQTSIPIGIDPIAPVYMYAKHITPDFLRMIRSKYGIRRFMMYGPGATIPTVHYPTMEDYEKAGRHILSFKKALADTDIEVNWWMHPTIKIGLNVPYQHIVNYDGTVSTLGLCPLDPQVRRDMAQRVARLTEIAGLSMVMIEDDYELSNHTGVTFGCFCPLHLAEFSRRMGKNYTREELVRIFQEDQRDTLPVREAFSKMSKETLCAMAKEVRQEVDKVSPSTRIAICEPGTADLDGYVTIDQAKAFAGPATRPLIRVCGTEYYCLDTPYYIPETMGHTLYTAEHLPADCEWMHESDNCPGTLFYMSAAFMETEINASLAMGAHTNYFYGMQGVQEGDFAHLEMYARNARRFEALREAACSSQGHLEGVRIVHYPLATSAKKLVKNNNTDFRSICGILARLGIPYSTKYGSPAILVGQEADVIPDRDLKELLKSGLFLDITAASILEKRGYGEYIGVHVQKEKSYVLNGERMARGVPEFAHIPDCAIPNSVYDVVCASDYLAIANPVPLKGAEVLTWYSRDEAPVQAGMVRFVNKLGGRVCVVANNLSNNYSANVIRYTKQKILRAVFTWLKGEELPAAAEGACNWTLVRETPRGTLFCITALGGDGRRDVTLHVAEKYRNRHFRELDDNGNWKEAAIEKLDSGHIQFKGYFPNMRMRIFQAIPLQEN